MHILKGFVYNYFELTLSRFGAKVTLISFKKWSSFTVFPFFEIICEEAL